MPDPIDGINGTCSSHGSCYDCVGIFAEEGNCFWCPSIGSCVNMYENNPCSGGEHATTCINSVYTIVFIVLVCVFTFICCGVCFFKINATGSNQRNLLPEQIRGIIFRNSLASLNEEEWMCIICGYENRPRAADCPMCGTSRKFTVDYKTEKKDLYKKKLERAEKKSVREQAKLSFFNNPLASLGFYDNDPKSPNPDDSRISQGVSYSKRVSMSAIERFEALNYRRLNALSLRQKGARRRRMWQRKVDEETGEIQWVRQTAQDTKVGSRTLGYDPRSSLCSPTKRTVLPGSTLGETLLSPERAPRDSFDDALASSSPGFTSVFTHGGDLEWERVETGTVVHNTSEWLYIIMILYRIKSFLLFYEIKNLLCACT